MLLNRNEIKQLIQRGVVENAREELVNGTSMDVTLAVSILVESTTSSMNYHTAEIGKTPLRMHPIEIDPVRGFLLHPGQFILGATEQVFHLPLNISAEYKLKSSMGRTALGHMFAGWCDAGWNNSVLTLELKNMSQYHNLVLRTGMRIGQVVFLSHRPIRRSDSYAVRGHYNNDLRVQGAKTGL